MGEVEIVIQFCGNPDLSGFNPTMLPISRMDEVSFRGKILEVVGDLFEEFLLVAFGGEVVVCAAIFHQVSSQFALSEQGVGGNGSSLDLNGVQQGRGYLDLISLLLLIATFDGKRTYFFWV